MDIVIPDGAIVYLDTNVVIYLTEGNAAFKSSIEHVFLAIEQAQARVVTSELTLTEALVKPLRDQNHAVLQAYDDLFDHLIEMIPIDRQVLYLSATLRAASPKQKTPDAIHVATAITIDASVFISGDMGIKNIPKHMQRIVL